ncbi:MAG: amidohydrolase family protein [Candidatus Acidiferrum sp.]
MKNPLTRRNFFTRASMFAGLGLPWGEFQRSIDATLSTAGARRAAAQPSGRIVDMHVHYRHHEPDFLDTFLKLADKLNLTGCLLTPFEHRKIVADAAKQHPTKIIPFGALHLDSPDVTNQMAELHDLGYRGLGEISGMQKNCSDPAYFPVFELASTYKWILTFHTGIVGRDKFDVPFNVASGRMRPIYLEEIARQFPRLTIFGAHLGNPEYDWAAEVTRWNPNVYFDLSGTTLPKMAGRLNDFKKIFWWSDVEWEAQPADDPSPYSKIVFGTDTGTPNMENVLNHYLAMFDACDVPEKTRKMILGGTVAKMLGLPD